ncbi:MAG TPA: bifunctional DNA primase/polymerase, partial [Verrucomicrobiae bacterium]|nr:bifunctional DNA primase/polymerase [Verrucomicrobiae bacterium]
MAAQLEAMGGASNTLGAVLSYAARGWPVFPLHSIRNGACSCGKADCKRGSAGKHPRIRHGLNAATCDEKT